MKLLTKQNMKELPKLYATDGQNEKQVIVKYFTPWANWTWYVVEGEQMENGDWEFFGLTEGTYNEWGYFWLSQLQEIKGPFGMKVERDLNYTGTKCVKTAA